jgi:hypothetical protein
MCKGVNILKNICNIHNIYFIDPVREIQKKGYNIFDLVVPENKIIHYNEKGHSVIKVIYEEFINKAILSLQ